MASTDLVLLVENSPLNFALRPINMHKDYGITVANNAIDCHPKLYIPWLLGASAIGRINPVGVMLPKELSQGALV
jgi:hypothetical protein